MMLIRAIYNFLQPLIVTLELNAQDILLSYKYIEVLNVINIFSDHAKLRIFNIQNFIEDVFVLITYINTLCK